MSIFGLSGAEKNALQCDYDRCFMDFSHVVAVIIYKRSIFRTFKICTLKCCRDHSVRKTLQTHDLIKYYFFEANERHRAKWVLLCLDKQVQSMYDTVLSAYVRPSNISTLQISSFYEETWPRSSPSWTRGPWLTGLGRESNPGLRRGRRALLKKKSHSNSFLIAIRNITSTVHMSARPWRVLR